MTPPQAKTSAGGPTRRPAICSGAMNAGVPIGRLAVIVVPSRARAIPKSITRGPSGPNSTLWGLKSQWTTPPHEWRRGR
jgi:hypothetical protein